MRFDLSELYNKLNMISEQRKELRLDLPFSLLILVYLLLLLYETLQLRPEPRLVPLLILIPGILITVVHIFSLIKPGVVPSFGTFSDVLMEDDDENDDDVQIKMKNMILIVGWFALLVAAFFLIGFLFGTALFAFSFLYLVGNQSLRQSLLVTIILIVVVYLVFIELINVRPLDPIIPLGLP